ncbi:MAG: PASTA domain-containing protein [Prevotellaceae bacterium]|jgi:beta-lactam-binding protein with PASTA domain|nr:PASTA domain-containing protein [Prevotellaceae bacterium]
MFKTIICFLKSKFLWANIAIAFVVLFVLGIGILSFLKFYTHHGEFVEVPDLNELYENEAEVILKENSLRYEVIDSIYLRDKKAGAIVEQTPKAGAKIKKNRIIYLTINTKEKKQVAVPNIIERSEAEAKQNLTNRGFNVVIEYEPSKYDDEVLDVKHGGRSIAVETSSGDGKTKRQIAPDTKLEDGATLKLIIGKSADYTEEDREVKETYDETFF